MAAFPYDVSLDQCLSACVNDPQRCAGVVHGFVGGRDILTCELYERVDLPKGVQYNYALNTYVLRVSMPCMVELEQPLPPFQTRPVDFQVRLRKQIRQRINSSPNPFNWGRKK